MVPPTKPLSLSDIHDIYRGPSKTKDAAEVEQGYRKTNRFAREAGHSGVAPDHPSASRGRRAR